MNSAAGAGLIASRDQGVVERRHLSVLFCDLVESTELAGEMEPEYFRDLVHRLNAITSDAVTRYGGQIAVYLGDGALAFFGYPLAHDDDARRAVMAGIEIVRRLTEVGDDELAARVAVHTGPVVVGDFNPGAPVTVAEVLGLTPNVAARLQGVAERNSVILSATTAKLVAGYFTFDSLGTFTFKGVPTPMECFRPTASLEQISRFDLSVSKGLTPYVGRAAELSWLEQTWRTCCESRTAALAAVLGDPGVGKTRLVHEFERALPGGHDVVELRASALHANQALYPVLVHLRERLGLDGDAADPDAAARRLVELIQQGGCGDAAAAALAVATLGLPVADPPDLPEGVELRRALTLEALVAVLQAGAPERPLLVFMEDAHWSDPTTMQLLEAMAAAPGRPSLVVCTARPEFEPTWVGKVSMRRLSGLPDAQARRIAEWLAARGPTVCDAETLDAMVERADGNPLFLEELAALVTQGSDAASAIPTTLADLLAGRIDRTGPGKRLLQAASVIGREFSLDLLSAVHDAGVDDIDAVLTRPEVADLVVEPGGSGARRFAFRHSLVRDAAYQTLLRREAAEIHGRIVTALLARTVPVASPPELIAHHASAAGLVEVAFEQYLLAATTAMSAGANTEALTYLDRADEMVERFPEGPERLMSELGVLAVRGPALMAQRGFGHPAVAATFRRAKEICDAVGDPIPMFPVLYGLLGYSMVRCELDAAAEISTTLLSAAQQQEDAGLSMLAHACTAQLLFIKGSFGAAAGPRNALPGEPRPGRAGGLPSAVQ